MYLFVYILPIEINVKNQNHKLTNPTPRRAVSVDWLVCGLIHVLRFFRVQDFRQGLHFGLESLTATLLLLTP